MHYQYLKAAQVILLVAAAAPTHHLPTLILALALSIYTGNHFYISSILSALAIIYLYLTTFSIIYLAYLAAIALLAYLLRSAITGCLSPDRLLPLFLLSLSITSMSDNRVGEMVQLAGLYLLMGLYYLKQNETMIKIAKVMRWLIVVELVVLSSAGWGYGLTETLFANQHWWYYLSFVLTVLFCSFIAKPHIPQVLEERRLPRQSMMSSDTIELEMQDMPITKKQENSEKQQQQAKQQQAIQKIEVPEEKMQSSHQQQITFKIGELESSSSIKSLPLNSSVTLKGQSLNLLLVIPFCLLGSSWWELPIYVYILALQWGYARPFLFVIMLCSLGVICAESQSDWTGGLLRLLGVLVVAKEVAGGAEVGELVRALWARGSFSLVLTILFWFSLLTVNVFHLLFIAIILLFITRDSQPHMRSYRHRNWKYLLFLFNLFLLLRLVHHFALQNGWQPNQWTVHLLELTGISFSYTGQSQLYNLVPLLINAIIGLQFITYNSPAYTLTIQGGLLRPYRVLLSKVAGVLAIVYYKLLPWVSYLIIISLLLVLEFSVSSLVLLTWVLLTLGYHILSTNRLRSYRRLYQLWLNYARLTSLQIVLRYVFEFAKFDLLSFIRNLPFFQFLLQYQQLLGLAIRDPDQVYLKTVTKFQLMVSLDLLAIFVAFLVTEYYTLLVKHAQIETVEVWGQEEKKVDEIYRNFVDFKLTVWISGKPFYRGLKFVCSAYHELFFPTVGLIACCSYNLLMLIYLILAIAYFLAINLKSYQTYIAQNFNYRLLFLLPQWHQSPQDTLDKRNQLSDLLIHYKRVIQDCKVKQHNKLRLWLVLVTVIAVIFTYISRVFICPQAEGLWSSQLLLRMRWWLYVGGCSIQQGFSSHMSTIMLLGLVLEMKCCWFINRFQLTADSHPELQQEAVVQQILTINQQNNSEDQGELFRRFSESAGSHMETSLRQQAEMEKMQEKQVVEMRVSLLLGAVKLLQRSFVMVLVLASIVQGSHPVGIVYLLCAILLNYLGSASIIVLSRLLSGLLIIQYLLVLANYSNSHIFHVPAVFSKYQQQTWLKWMFGLPQDWQWYVTFGKDHKELAMLAVSWLVLVCYQCYFLALRQAWTSILRLLSQKIVGGRVNRRFMEHVRQVYEYGLTYSPVVIMLLCLAIYLMDYSVTNLLLTAFTAGFLFLSFLVREYRDNRHFWRTYFVILQMMVVFFMLIYSLLQLPMLAHFCNRFLCAPEQLHSQVYKALLLLILQLGLDLTNSHHFDRALKHLEQSRRRVKLQRLAIAFRHNDRKIAEKFKQLKQEKDLQETIKEVNIFFQELKTNPQAEFVGRGQDYASKQTWIEVLLEFLPELIDENLMLNEKQAKQDVTKANFRWMDFEGISDEDLSQINDSYIERFKEKERDQLEEELKMIINKQEKQEKEREELEIIIAKTDKQYKEQNVSQYAPPAQHHHHRLSRRSHSHAADNLPFQSYRRSATLSHAARSSHSLQLSRREEKSLILAPDLEEGEVLSAVRESVMEEGGEGKKQLLYLLLVESVLSNWQYLTYLAIILVHVRNLGLLTLPLPIVCFCFGMVSSYHAGKQVWRWLFLLLLLPLIFKSAVKVGLLQISKQACFLLIGTNLQSVFLEFVGLVCVVGECVILKMIGHFDETTQQIECMRMGLVRKIINTNYPQERQYLFQLLRQSQQIPSSQQELLFSTSEIKPGYDYTTVLTALQLTVLIWVFLFYDRMAVRQEVTFYQMIEYNQFSSGMVALTLLQLVFLLGERFISIAALRKASERWEMGLIFKYILLVLNLLLIQSVVLLYFPISSGRYAANTYVTVLLLLSLLTLLVAALQVRKGLDQASRGFMDRYTWYNGFIYMGFRAIPFLFEFKAFSDWTFTKTAIRIFDWIRLEQIFGRFYVAKCNALFLSGKLMGSRIEWWKKLLMGYPLLLSIILLLFGPLVLFSSLNPLASPNDLTAGYLQIVLRVNRTNEYPLYTNSHITDIHRMQKPTQREISILSSYDIDQQTVQVLHLQEFSDQYWEISEGSYYKLLAEPQGSLYQLSVRGKFDRNQTGLTSLYVLSTYQLPSDRISQLKQALLGKRKFCVQGLLNTFLRLDNNNGLHYLGEDRSGACLRAAQGVRASKQYWVLQGGLRLRIASDKYTKAVFGYSVMSFYISIILVIANQFRFLFQGAVHTILTNDIPHPDPVLALCNGVYRARRIRDLVQEEHLFWTIIDLLRSPDTVKSLTGNYLQARLETLKMHKLRQEMEAESESSDSQKVKRE